MDIYKEVTDRIIAELEKGIIPWEKPWISSGSCISHATGKAYSLLNQMLLGRPGEYITFKQAQQEGGRVRKGEKASMVVFWKWIEEKDPDTEEVKQIPFLRYYNVFHIDQCEGLKARRTNALPNTASADQTADAIITAYCEREGVKLIHEEGDRAFYTPSADRITLPHMAQFTATAEYYSTAFHELTHSTGHVSRLNRLEKVAFFGTEAYSKEELVAEIGAAALVNAAGLETANSFRKYSQDIRSAICYLAMIKPSENYLFKSTPAHHFAEYMEYPNDIGAGQTFKLKHYYDMCDRLIELAGKCPELLEADASRPSTWKDPSRHVLAYDLIYCMDAYELTSGMIHPPVKSKSGSAKQRAYRAEMATMVQKEIDGLQDQVDELNHQIDELSPASFEGKLIRTKAFGMVTIKQQRGRYLLFEAGGSEKQFVLPDCIANGFLIPEETEVIERYKQEQKLQKQVNLLERKQKVKFLEMQKFLD